MHRPLRRLAVINLHLLEHLGDLEAGRQRGVKTFRQTSRQIARAKMIFSPEDALAQRMLALHEQRTRWLRLQQATRHAAPITLSVIEPSQPFPSRLSWWRQTWAVVRQWLVHPLIDTRVRPTASAPVRLSKAA